MDFFQAVNLGLQLIGIGGGGGGYGGRSGYGEDPNFTGGGGGSAQTRRTLLAGDSFLDIVKSGAGAFVSSREGAADPFGTTEIPRQSRSISDLTRGQAAPGGLTSPLQQLFQQAAVIEAARHLRENGSRDLNMQSMMNDLGYVRPTTIQGKKTVVTEQPELSEISVR